LQHGGGGGGSGIGCYGSPCAFGCTPYGQGGFSCGCPSGYQRIGQVWIHKIFRYTGSSSKLSYKGFLFYDVVCIIVINHLLLNHYYYLIKTKIDFMTNTIALILQIKISVTQKMIIYTGTLKLSNKQTNYRQFEYKKVTYASIFKIWMALFEWI